MRAKVILFLILALCLSVSVSAQNEKTKTKTKSNQTNERTRYDPIMIDLETSAWKNLVDKKYDDFARMLADDYQGVYPAGITTKDGELAEVRKTTFKSAELSDVKVRWVDENTAIVTATVKAEITTPDGKTTNSTARTASIFTKRANQWLCVFHADVMFNPKEYTVSK
jgi:ketosteroid isomerase-like protein